MSEVQMNLAQALGASEETSSQVLTLYIPNQDKLGRELGTQRKWVLEAAELLAQIGGGFTILPPVEGGWVTEKGAILWEHPVMLYSYVKPDRFLTALPALREFLHRLGRETRQGEVALEFAGRFYRITQFDRKRKERQS